MRLSPNFLLTIFASIVFTAIVSIFISSPLHADFDHSYGLYEKLLDKYTVIEGKQTLVDYRAIKENPEEILNIISNLSSVTREEYKRFTRNQKLAFLINTYNAFTIKLIVDNYPITSIKKIGWFFQSPWKRKVVNIFNKTYTLDNIEHGLIRKKFKEPRIHFAVNCASMGCPSLLKKPFVATLLEEQLHAAAKNFLTNTGKNRYDPESNKIYISKIFKWYGSDWKKMKKVHYMRYIEKFIPEIVGKNPSLRYTDYDWSLNNYKHQKQGEVFSDRPTHKIKSKYKKDLKKQASNN